MFPVGMSSRLRKAYVAAKFFEVLGLTARARLSVATAACSSGKSRNCDCKYVGGLNADEQELVPTGSFLRSA
jgi:hypothetical protein